MRRLKCVCDRALRCHDVVRADHPRWFRRRRAVSLCSGIHLRQDDQHVSQALSHGERARRLSRRRVSGWDDEPSRRLRHLHRARRGQIEAPCSTPGASLRLGHRASRRFASTPRPTRSPPRSTAHDHPATGTPMDRTPHDGLTLRGSRRACIPIAGIGFRMKSPRVLAKSRLCGRG